MEFNTAINGATVIDGSGAARFKASVGISNGKIAAVSREPLRANQEIDARDLVIAPGFTLRSLHPFHGVDVEEARSLQLREERGERRHPFYSSKSNAAKK